jgi:hypothetical protein
VGSNARLDASTLDGKRDVRREISSTHLIDVKESV